MIWCDGIGKKQKILSQFIFRVSVSQNLPKSQKKQGEKVTKKKRKLIRTFVFAIRTRVEHLRHPIPPTLKSKWERLFPSTSAKPASKPVRLFLFSFLFLFFFPRICCMCDERFPARLCWLFFLFLADLFASPRSSPKTNDAGNSCWELYCLEVRFFFYHRDAGFWCEGCGRSRLLSFPLLFLCF